MSHRLRDTKLYQVLLYSFPTLLKLLGDHERAAHVVIAEEHFFVYFKSYFEELPCAKIVVENQHVDRDYQRVLGPCLPCLVSKRALWQS